MSSSFIALAITLLCIILFLTEALPNAVTACLGCVLMVLSGVSSFETVFSSFGGSIVLLLAGAMVVGNAMFETGAAQLIGRQVIRWSRGNGRLFLLIGGTVAGILSMFLANNAVIAIFLTIIDSICLVSPSLNHKDYTLPIACCAMVGGACTLVGCTPQLTANGILQEMTGLNIGMWDLLGPGICLLVIYILYFYFLGYFRGQRIWGDRPLLDKKMAKDDTYAVFEKEFDQKKLITMLFIVTAMIISYAVGWISTTMTALCAAMLCLITRCCDPKHCIQELNWDCLIFLAGSLGIANGLTESGAGELISGCFLSVLGASVNPMFAFSILVLLTLIISQVITNSTAIIITLPISLSLCSAYGFSHKAFCLGIVYAASLACSTPLAAAQITVTQVAGYRFSDYVRYTWPLAVLSFIGILIFVPLFFPLVL